eukprot:TRINITY_DN1547_c0_g1_i1.p1 TRINITY_DN1547_c0_g1~~TRINITY_DN1547_c0_g1_i1.p1  ORF type:complete len:258 (-),score=90.21 TRINITY_DN1547_c0_g1_i1:81-854(-)
MVAKFWIFLKLVLPKSIIHLKTTFKEESLQDAVKIMHFNSVIQALDTLKLKDLQELRTFINTNYPNKTPISKSVTKKAELKLAIVQFYETKFQKLWTPEKKKKAYLLEVREWLPQNFEFEGNFNARTKIDEMIPKFWEFITLYSKQSKEEKPQQKEKQKDEVKDKPKDKGQKEEAKGKKEEAKSKKEDKEKQKEPVGEKKAKSKKQTGLDALDRLIEDLTNEKSKDRIQWKHIQQLCRDFEEEMIEVQLFEETKEKK